MPYTPRMTRRSKTWLKPFGASLAGFALSLQLVFASWGMLAMATPADTAAPFAGHALCLAGAPAPAAPDQPAPAVPAHDHTAFCCLWHPIPAIQPIAAGAPLPVAYAELAPADFGAVPFAADPRHNPANARAPPALI